MKKLLLILGILFATPVFATVGDTSLGRVVYGGNAVQTVFYFFFPASSLSDVHAVVTSGTAGTAIYFLNSDQIASPGGTVTYTVAPSNGSVVTIERDMQYTQTLALDPYFPFPAKAVEKNFDRTILLIQQVARNLADFEVSCCTPGGGGGSLTSVGLSMPGTFSVLNSPLVANGTISVSWTAQARNVVLAGPTSGANQIPTFRALVAADFPALGPGGVGGSFGDATHIPLLTIGASGLVTAASTSTTQLAGINLSNVFTRPNIFTSSHALGDNTGYAISVTGSDVFGVTPADDGIRGTGGSVGAGASAGGYGVKGSGGAGGALAAAGGGVIGNAGAVGAGGGGVGVTGNGSGAQPGVKGSGGALSGDGGQFAGGSPNGIGGRFTGQGTGAGAYAIGGPDGSEGTPSGMGFYGQGGGTGPGGYFVGGPDDVGGTGAIGVGVTQAPGLCGVGAGIAAAICGETGPNGVKGFGGTSNGAGVDGQGGGNGPGGHFQGGATNGTGEVVLGMGTGPGSNITGGSPAAGSNGGVGQIVTAGTTNGSSNGLAGGFGQQIAGTNGTNGNTATTPGGTGGYADRLTSGTGGNGNTSGVGGDGGDLIIAGTVGAGGIGGSSGAGGKGGRALVAVGGAGGVGGSVSGTGGAGAGGFTSGMIDVTGGAGGAPGTATGTGGVGGNGGKHFGGKGGSTTGAGTGGTGGIGANNVGGNGGDTVAGTGGTGGIGANSTGGNGGTGNGSGGLGHVIAGGNGTGSGSNGTGASVASGSGGTGTASGLGMQITQNNTIRAHVNENILAADPSSLNNGDDWCMGATTSMTCKKRLNGATQPIITVGANGSGAVQVKRNVSACVTAASAGAVCNTTVTWPTAFPDANYTCTCNGAGIASGVPALGGVSSKVAASCTIQVVAVTAVAAQFSTVECIAVHD